MYYGSLFYSQNKITHKSNFDVFILGDEVPKLAQMSEETLEMSNYLDCHVEILENSIGAIFPEVVGDDGTILSDTSQIENECSLMASVDVEESGNLMTSSQADQVASILAATVDAEGRCILSQSPTGNAIIFSTVSYFSIIGLYYTVLFEYIFCPGVIGCKCNCYWEYN